jgi:hypothetical protein
MPVLLFCVIFKFDQYILPLSKAIERYGILRWNMLWCSWFYSTPCIRIHHESVRYDTYANYHMLIEDLMCGRWKVYRLVKLFHARPFMTHLDAFPLRSSKLPFGLHHTVISIVHILWCTSISLITSIQIINIPSDTPGFQLTNQYVVAVSTGTYDPWIKEDQKHCCHIIMKAIKLQVSQFINSFCVWWKYCIYSSECYPWITPVRTSMKHFI